MTLTRYLKDLKPSPVVAYYRLKQGVSFQYILILDQINEMVLKDLSAIIKDTYLECKILSETEFLNCLDVFPMEFLDFKYQGELLLGSDIIRDRKASKKNLRHECEFYLRSRLLSLREAYVSIPDQTALLINDSFPLFRQTFRYLALMLRLKWDVNDFEGSMKTLGKTMGVDVSILIRIHDHLDRPQFLDAHFFEYHDTLTEIVQFVDGMD